MRWVDDKGWTIYMNREEPSPLASDGRNGCCSDVGHGHDAGDRIAGLPAVDLHLCVVTPVFNDFTSFAKLCHEIDTLVVEWGVRVYIFVIDDGSLERPCELHPFGSPLANIEQVRLIKLKCNLGHQRAIAIGLVEAAKTGKFDVVLVSDSDGEDRPADFSRLIAAYRSCPQAIVVASRAERSESLRFRTFYGLYKGLFRLLAGRGIDFGNFTLIPRPLLARIITMSDTWNHLAASILRSRVPIRRVACKRGQRYAGRSSMNLASLLIHGLSALAVFSDEIFARMLVASAAITTLAAAMAAVAVGLRFATNLAIPGWTTNVVGISLVLLSEALLFAMMAALMMLQGRAAMRVVPSEHAGIFIEASLVLYEKVSGKRDKDGVGQ